jgi:hypothetical protein
MRIGIYDHLFHVIHHLQLLYYFISISALIVA